MPEDVRLTHWPLHSGWDWLQLSERIAVAEHYSNTVVKPWAFRQAGRRTALNALATLFELMWEDSAWVSRSLNAGSDSLAGAVDFPAYFRSLVLYRLLQLRQAAAEVLMQQPSVLQADRPLEVQRNLLKRALHITLTGRETGNLIFFEQNYADAADTFLGQVLAYQVRRRLEERFGTPWYAQTPAIRYVKTVWRRGLDWPLPSFLQSLQLGLPRFAPLQNSLRQLLKHATMPSSREAGHEANVH